MMAAHSDIGLPPDSAVMALLLFNVGVDVGQLMIVVVMLVILAGWRVVGRQLTVLDNPRLQALPVQCMGIVASYWFTERTLGLMFQGA